MGGVPYLTELTQAGGTHKAKHSDLPLNHYLCSISGEFLEGKFIVESSFKYWQEKDPKISPYDTPFPASQALNSLLYMY